MLLVKWGYAQKITGKVYELEAKESKTKQSLPGATIYWKNTSLGVITNENGYFEIESPTTYPATLIVSYVGYQSDSLIFVAYKNNITISLSPTINLAAFEVVERNKSSAVSLVSPIHIETLSEKELGKAACCNISESFETNASVDVNFTDAVSGTKKIQMLGLDGFYTQIQIENIPFVRGLSSAYGLTFMLIR